MLAESETNQLIEHALSGNKDAMEKLLEGVQDTVFNLSLRMLGTIADAEDASQEILVRVMKNVKSFRKESAFSTWVYRIAVNYLIGCRKSLFAEHPLSFEFYERDIGAGFLNSTPADLMGVEEDILAQELKLSCTNVMLQCFDAQSRCIYILGTMFKIDSKIAADILNTTPENYRQKLSRARRKMGDFLSGCCGLSGTGTCSCKKRVGYAIKQHRLDPSNLEYLGLKKLDKALLTDVTNQMEAMDQLSAIFAGSPKYKSPKSAAAFLRRLIDSPLMANIQNST
jgi:RNA polymerase sigma factor (sigma-70 family)